MNKKVCKLLVILMHDYIVKFLKTIEHDVFKSENYLIDFCRFLCEQEYKAKKNNHFTGLEEWTEWKDQSQSGNNNIHNGQVNVEAISNSINSCQPFECFFFEKSDDIVFSFHMLEKKKIPQCETLKRIVLKYFISEKKSNLVTFCIKFILNETLDDDKLEVVKDNNEKLQEIIKKLEVIADLLKIENENKFDDDMDANELDRILNKGRI